MADKFVAKTNLEEYDGKTVYDIIKKIELPRNWLPELMQYASKRKLTFLSSCFDEEAIDLLDEIGATAFKIASGELTNLPLLRYTAQKGKPLIVATGGSTLDEIEEAVKVIESTNNHDVILLHCISSYPTPTEEANLKFMVTLKKTFHLPIGYSDHTLGILAPLVAVSMGAILIEKHFTLDRNLQGPDHSYALEPQELKTMVENVRAVEKLLGSSSRLFGQAELKNSPLGRRSIFANKDIPAGTIIAKEMLSLLRPGFGLAPKYLSRVVGREATEDIKQFDLITWNKISG